MKKSPEYVWVHYSKKEPHLPDAIADSPEEMAKLRHTSANAISSAITHGQTLYAKVRISEV